MKNHGKIRKGFGNDNEFYILENDLNEFFLVKNPQRFESADRLQQHIQKIFRIISRTIFFRRETAELYAYSEEEKNTLSVLHNKFDRIFDFDDKGVDDKLKSIVKLCEGADNSDVEKFKYTARILEYSELKEAGSKLHYGTGFPGVGIGLIVCKEYFPFEKTIVYIEKVDSYMEGYTVDHFQILPEMIIAIKKGLIPMKYFK